ncbi:MAG: DUF2304 domain-containing protein [Armatimonadota bacterium]
MHLRIQIIAIVLSVFVLVAIFELVRKRKLREEYSLLWLFAGISFLALSIRRDLVERISAYMGVSYGPSALFIAAFLFGALLALHFSLILSQLAERIRILTQQNALLGLELTQLQKKQNSTESKCAANVAECGETETE